MIKKVLNIFLISLISMFIFTGCISKALMPYEEEPLCSKGKESGYCGSVSDVFETIEYGEMNDGE